MSRAAARAILCLFSAVVAVYLFASGDNAPALMMGVVAVAFGASALAKALKGE